MDPEKRGAGAGGFSPAIVFAVLLIMVVTGAIFLTTRQEPPGPKAASSPEATPSPTTHRLSDAEAIARFKHLDKLRRDAYEAPDPSAVEGIFAPGTDIRRTVERELRKLHREDVVSKSSFRTESVRVLYNGPERIRLRQVVVISPRFLAQDGQDVTGRAFTERQTIDWSLVHIEDAWLVADSIVTKAERVS